jgi:hypothetical protein
MWKIECPQCHSFFSVVTEENKKLIQDEKVEDSKETIPKRMEDALEGLIPYSQRIPGSMGKDVNADYLTYEYKFKCTHCGKEWTELKEKERVSKDPYTQIESAELNRAKSDSL